MRMKERFSRLLGEMNEGVFEKESEMVLSLLAALAGQSVILLGPPGVAKSMVARRLKLAFRNGRSFEYLMSRFSTPDEIFGPVSITRLKTSDSYERVVDGYLPTADVVFLDEIWKAGPAIQNTLLTVINEKIFRNGNRVLQLPLKLLVAASNELPAKGEGLEALWDRFIIRIESRPIATEAHFNAMLRLRDDVVEMDSETEESLPNAISAAEYARWSGEIDKVVLPDDVLQCIHVIRKSLRQVRVDEAAERDAIRRIVLNAVFAAAATRLADIKRAVEEDIRYHRVRVMGRLAAHQRDYEAEIERLSDLLRQQESHIKENLYVSTDDLKELDDYLKDFYREVAFTRQDVSKLYVE